MYAHLKTLIGKLNTPCKAALEKSAESCVSHSNFSVEIEHLLQALLDFKDTDLTTILSHYDVNVPILNQQIEQTIQQFKRGANRTPSLSPHLLKLLERAWLYCSIELSLTQIRSCGLLMALLTTDEIRGFILEKCPALLTIPLAQLTEDLPHLLKASSEKIAVAQEYGAFSTGGGRAPRSGKTQALDQYTIDITAQAEAGKIDPIAGRDNEIRQMIDVLTRRRQNNPILVGDAGVGKTAIVEGLALRISKKDVPPPLKKVRLHLLDMGLLEAGAGIKGEFENRLKSVIEEVQASPHPIILFIDEAHTIIGRGGNSGENDAANLLKPALARGELKTIAATTWDEYKKYFEKDAALTRRFQLIKVEEPSEEAAISMLRAVMPSLEAHHCISILNEGLIAAVHLSQRYLAGRKLPDKAVSVLDTAGARVQMAHTATPIEIESLHHDRELLEAEKQRLEREESEGIDHKERLQEIAIHLEATNKELIKLSEQWKFELALVQNILEVQKALWKNMTQPGQDTTKHQEQLLFMKKQLEQREKETSLIPLCVDKEVVAKVISEWTGIPVGKMLKDEISTILDLENILSKRIIGQKPALKTLTEHIRAYRAGLQAPDKPMGIFMLVGPSGVGKTETALALADILYGGERNLITINMSEYQEAHTISSLRGSPPGYVGYGKGGILTEAVRRNPYSIILLDEIEKAHPDVIELFYQTFDKGVMEDGEGIEVDFKNTIILLTSNFAGDDIAAKFPKEGDVDPRTVIDAVRPLLTNHFKAAFLGRVTVVPYHGLSMSQLRHIIDLKLDKIKKRYEKQHQAELSFSPEIMDLLLQKCEESDTGALLIDNVISQHLLPQLSARILERIAQDAPRASAHMRLEEKGNLTCDFVPLQAA